ncbi:TPA: hypothetical protein ACH3X3_007422 [Trebouxia sp. C0006]
MRCVPHPSASLTPAGKLPARVLPAKASVESSCAHRAATGQGILASTLSSKLTCANYHRLGVVARAGERGSRARNASGWNLVKEVALGRPVPDSETKNSHGILALPA